VRARALGRATPHCVLFIYWRTSANASVPSIVSSVTFDLTAEYDQMNSTMIRMPCVMFMLVLMLLFVFVFVLVVVGGGVVMVAVAAAAAAVVVA
jgi:hypothetical protein